MSPRHTLENYTTILPMAIAPNLNGGDNQEKIEICQNTHTPLSQ